MVKLQTLAFVGYPPGPSPDTASVRAGPKAYACLLPLLTYAQGESNASFQTREARVSH